MIDCDKLNMYTIKPNLIMLVKKEITNNSTKQMKWNNNNNKTMQLIQKKIEIEKIGKKE